MSRNTIPVDVLRAILKHVDKADLVTICQLNKICCSCSQDVLYRNINIQLQSVTQLRVHQTLAQSAHLARRVHSFATYYSDPVLPMALRNMSSLRHLKLMHRLTNADILEGCTFKLESFTSYLFHTRSFFQFLDSQPSLTDVECWTYRDPNPQLIEASPQSIKASSLPNLTRIAAEYSKLQQFITGRPISDVIVFIDLIDLIDPDEDSVDFTLSTAPIKRLRIDYSYLRRKPFHLLASTFSSLTNLSLDAFSFSFEQFQTVCDPDLI